MNAPSPDVPQVDEDFARTIHARDFERAAQLLAQGARVNRVIRTQETFDRDAVEETSTLLITVSRRGDVDAVRFLLAHKADPNIATEYSGRTALTEAAVWGQARAVDALLAGGADFTAVDRYNHRDALGYATEKVNPPIVRSLLAAGAKGTFCRLGFSVDGGQAARDVVQLLVDHRTDINETDDWGGHR